MRKNQRRIEKKSSNTAAYTCVSRASSYYECSPQYKSNDYIAPLLLPHFLKPLIKLPKLRKFFASKLAPAGIYEYVIARTKYIDNLFSSIITRDFEQIIIFGAGFDTRSIRLRNNNETIKIFELDVPTTMGDKLKQYHKRHIDKGSTIYIEIDFTTDSIEEKLKQNGFQFGKKTLYLLEGILMYLNEDAVDADFKFIQESAKAGSEIIFDFLYKSVLRKENLYYGEAEIYHRVNAEGEGWTYGIEKECLSEFLDRYGLKLVEKMDAQGLETKFFTNAQGEVVGKINGTHCIVHACIN